MAHLKLNAKYERGLPSIIRGENLVPSDGEFSNRRPNLTYPTLT